MIVFKLFRKNMKTLPKTAKPYKRTPIFNESNIPAGLLKDHNTKSGVWGIINVIEGKLEYCITDADNETHDLNPDKFGVVEPEVKHFIKPIGPVKVFIEFYK